MTTQVAGPEADTRLRAIRVISLCRGGWWRPGSSTSDLPRPCVSDAGSTPVAFVPTEELSPDLNIVLASLALTGIGLCAALTSVAPAGRLVGVLVVTVGVLLASRHHWVFGRGTGFLVGRDGISSSHFDIPWVAAHRIVPVCTVAPGLRNGRGPFSPGGLTSLWNVIAIEVDLDAVPRPRAPGSRQSGRRTYALVEARQLRDPEGVLRALSSLLESPERRATISAADLQRLFREVVPRGGHGQVSPLP